MNRLIVTLFFLIAMATTGCNCMRSTTDTGQSGGQPAGIWVNPVITVIQHPQIEGIGSQGELHQENGTVMDQLQAFCNRNNEKFRMSGMQEQEAALIYAGLFQSGLIRNEEVGMPDPDTPLEVESFENFKSRVAIKVNPDGGYYIFFRRTGCGFHYVLGSLEADMATGKIVISPLEVWHTSVPC